MTGNVKPFKTINEQIDLLESRNLIIEDREEARKSLIRLNYYRLSGYSLTLRKDDRFYSGVSFDGLMQLYNFDSELRVAVLYLLENVEVSFRTFVCYYHAKTYGSLGYLEETSFKDGNKFKSFIDRVKDIINKNSAREIFITHHMHKYNGDIPIWVIVELLSFGELSKLFKNIDRNTQNEICHDNFEKITPQYIENWLQAFSILRNICAHRGRLYNRFINFSIKLSGKDIKRLKSDNLEINAVNKQLFSYIFVLFKLIEDQSVKHNFIKRLEDLQAKYPFTKMEYFGFPGNWYEYLN